MAPKTNKDYPYMRGVNLDADTTAAVVAYIQAMGWSVAKDFSRALREIIREWMSR